MRNMSYREEEIWELRVIIGNWDCWPLASIIIPLILKPCAEHVIKWRIWPESRGSRITSFYELPHHCVSITEAEHFFSPKIWNYFLFLWDFSNILHEVPPQKETQHSLEISPITIDSKFKITKYPRNGEAKMEEFRAHICLYLLLKSMHSCSLRSVLWICEWF